MPYQRPSGLIVPTADLAGPAGTPVLQELSPITGGHDITRGLIDSLPLLPVQDSLAARSTGISHLDLYLDVLDDWQVFSALQARRLAVCATEWEVLPGGPRRRDKQAADLISAILDAQPWDQITGAMHYGVFFGWAVAECLWLKDGAQVVPGAIRVRDARRFGFRPDGTLVLLTVTDPLGQPMPQRKFWSFRTGAYHQDDPYGMGLAHWCYWPRQFKIGTIKLWLVALDKYASPTALGHFPTTASPTERAKLLRALEAIRSQSALILPDGMTAELLSASRTGGADYAAANEYWDRAISKIISGHSAVSDATPGRLGGEDMGRDVRHDLVTADADLLCASANQTWVRWVVDWSYPGAAYPKVWRRMEEDEDLNTRAEREKNLFTLGYRPTLAQIKDTYGGEWEATAPSGTAPAGDVALAGTAPGAVPVEVGTGQGADLTPGVMPPDDPAAPAVFAEHLEPAREPGQAAPAPGQALIDAQAATDPGWQAAMEQLLAPILAGLEQGLTPEELLGQLAAWYPQMDDAALLAILDRGVAAADTIGRLEVQEPADG